MVSAETTQREGEQHKHVEMIDVPCERLDSLVGMYLQHENMENVFYNNSLHAQVLIVKSLIERILPLNIAETRIPEEVESYLSRNLTEELSKNHLDNFRELITDRYNEVGEANLHNARPLREVPYAAMAGLINRYRYCVPRNTFTENFLPHHETIARWFESRLEVHKTDGSPIIDIPVQPVARIFAITDKEFES